MQLTRIGQRTSRREFLRVVGGAPIASYLTKNEQICECHHVAGDDDYLLKVRCRGTEDLDHLLTVELKEKIGVARTRTTIVLGTAKESVRVPIAED